MAKKNLGSKLALYPTPVTVVGAMTDNGPNWLLVAHVGIIGHDRVTISCAKEDKSDAFAWSAAEDGAPLIDESPLSLACSVADVYETEGFETFVLAIDGTYVDEGCLNEKGKIDYGKAAPVLFEFPTYSYWRLGDRIGGCLRLDKE